MKKILKYTSVVLTSAAIVALPIFSASAETSTTTVTANINSTLSMSSDANASFTINPTSTQAKSSSNKATVTVSTNNATGYNLKIGMIGADNALKNTAAVSQIDAHTGSFGAPAAMALNKWGYRVDGAGTFGAGTTTAETDVNDLAQTWAAVPVQNSEDTIKNHASAVQSHQTDVYFGAKVDATKPSGAYTGQVQFTAVAN